MTEATFIQIHVNGAINLTGRINVNYDDNGDNTGTISGLTVTKSALSVDGVSNQDLETVLDQVEAIRFIFNNVLYNLAVVKRSFYNTAIPFYYFGVDPFTVPDISSGVFDDLAPSVSIDFTPFITDLQFAFSEYNPLIGNAQVNRPSRRQVEADRVENNSQPGNWQSIIDGNASPATIQDSLYSDTGWSNARYKGSVSTSENYSGVSPAVIGRSFKGEIFQDTFPTSSICSIAVNDRILEELFFTSDETSNKTKLPFWISGSTTPVSIFKFTGNTSKILAANDAAIFIEGNSTIMFTNEYGQVINSSSCG